MSKKDEIRVGWTEIPFVAEIHVDSKLVAQEVRAMLSTSKLTYDRPEITLFPTESQYELLISKWQMEIRAFTHYVGGDKEGEIHVPRGYFNHSKRSSLGPSWTECVVKVEPAELYVKHYLHGESEESGKAHIDYFLTEARGLGPVSTVEQSYTGEVRLTASPRVMLDFKNGWVGKFERHYQYADTEVTGAKGIFSTSHLVLTLEKEGHALGSIEEAQGLSKFIDDFLWYLSFAGRQRVTWVRWISIINTECVEYTRSVCIPRQDDEEELIELWETQEFLQHCLDYMQKEGNLNLYVPLLNLVAAERRETVESKFMSLYTALEALLFSYANSRNRNKLFSDIHVWEAFKKELIQTIESSKNLNYDKSPMLQKLGIFNQRSLQSLYNEFCSDFSIDNSDLWPVFHGNFSLSRIRNKLVHGEELRYEQLQGLSIAEENLRWIVERCLLGIIGWTKPTRITSWGGLSIYTAYKDWKRYFEK
jgi:hypothetical protein